MLMRSSVLRLGDYQADEQAHRILLGTTPADSDPVFSHPDELPDHGLVSHAVTKALKGAKLFGGRLSDPKHAYCTLLPKSTIHRKMVGDKFERSDIYIRVDAYGHAPAGAGDVCRDFHSLITVEKGGTTGGEGPALASTGR